MKPAHYLVEEDSLKKGAYRIGLSGSFVSKLVDAVIVLFIFVFAFLCFYPMWYVFVVSITPYGDFVDKAFIFLPPLKPDLSYYVMIIGDGWKVFSRAMGISFMKTGLGATLAVMMTGMLAYAVSKRNVKGMKLINVMMVLTLFFSGGLIPLYILIIKLNLYNSFWVMVVTGLVHTGHFIIMRNYFSYAVPPELEDAALMDGTSEFTVFFRIVMPICKPMFAAIFLFEAVSHWNDFTTYLYFVEKIQLQPFVWLLRRALRQPSVLMITAAGTAEEVLDEDVWIPPRALKMATIICAMVPIMLVYPFLQRHFAKGILIGAVKE